MARNLGKAFWSSCAVVAALVAASVQAPAQPLKGDWPMLNFDGKNQRYNPYETVLNKKTVKSLQLAWKLDITPGDTLSPAIVGGVLYIGSNDGNFYACDAVSGQKRWTVNLGGLPASASPTVVNGVVYVPDGHALHALDAATGSVLWSTNFEEGTWGSPVVSHGLVFQDTQRARLVALNARSGKELWITDVNGGNDSAGSPAVANGVVYTYSGLGLNAYTASTGVLLWHVDGTGNPSMTTSPAVAYGKVYYGNGGDVVAYDAATGALIWRNHSGPNIYESIAVTRKHVYALDSAGVIWNYNADTGNLSLMQGQNGLSGSPTIANGVLYAIAPTSNKDVGAYDVKTGTLLWSAPLPSTSPGTSPVVSNGMLYVVAGSLFAFALKN